MHQDIDIYISFWTRKGVYWKKDFNALSKSDINEDSTFFRAMMSIAVNNAKKHYSNVYLVTDEEGLNLFNGIEFTDTFTWLEDLDKTYQEYWSLGKLYCNKKAAELGRPFVQIDYDVVLKNPLPNWLTRSPIYTQSPEDADKWYYLDYIYDNYKYLGHLETRTQTAYNCGIIGCSDTEAMLNYAKSAIKFTLVPENKHMLEFDVKEAFGWPTAKAVWIEQYYLGSFCKSEGIPMKVLLPSDDYNVQNAMADKLGYFHFWGAKHDPAQRKSIIKLASSLYDI